MGKTVVIIATLDTRGDEVEYLKDILEESGHTALTVDAGVLGDPPFPGDYPRERVAEAGAGPWPSWSRQRKRGRTGPRPSG